MTFLRGLGRLSSSPVIRRAGVNRILGTAWHLHRPALTVLQRDISIGILREDYDKWERRV